MPKLDVIFFAQNDNERWIDGAHGNTQCHVTSESMLVAFLKPELLEWSRKNGFREFESYVRSKYYQYTKSRGDHSAMTRTLKNDFKIDSEWRYDGNYSDIRKQIDDGVPVTIGVDYRSVVHIIVVTGYDSFGFFVNDPYGIRSGSNDWYAQINPGRPSEIGKDDYYSLSTFDKVWHNGEGWYRKILSKH